jgi:hypothetical protein
MAVMHNINNTLLSFTISSLPFRQHQSLTHSEVFMMVEYRPGKLRPVFWPGGGPNMVDVDLFMALVDGFGVMRSHVVCGLLWD